MNGVGPIELLLGELSKVVWPHEVADVLEELRQSALIDRFYIISAADMVLVWPSHGRNIEAGLYAVDAGMPAINWGKMK